MATTETFWDQIGAYNDATFPLQMIMVVVAIILTHYAFAKPTRKTNRQNALECTNVTRIEFYSEQEPMV